MRVKLVREAKKGWGPLSLGSLVDMSGLVSCELTNRLYILSLKRHYAYHSDQTTQISIILPQFLSCRQ